VPDIVAIAVRLGLFLDLMLLFGLPMFGLYRGDYTKVSFTYAIYERMQYDAGEGCCRRQRSP